MKTLEDLVEQLNEEFSVSCGKIRKPFAYKESDHNSLECSITFGGADMIYFNKSNKQYLLCNGINRIGSDCQDLIVRYLAKTYVKDWFPEEKKYNIIIGKNIGASKALSAYYKRENGDVAIDDVVLEKDLIDEKFIFSESEISRIKHELPVSMKQIVDLGLVEVRYA